jgi:hypothetical protein
MGSRYIIDFTPSRMTTFVDWPIALPTEKDIAAATYYKRN